MLKDGVRQQILMVKQEIHLDHIMVRKLIGGSTFMPPVDYCLDLTVLSC